MIIPYIVKKEGFIDSFMRYKASFYSFCIYIYIVYKSRNKSGIARNVMSILFRNYTQNFLSKNNKLALVLCMCYVQIFIKIGFFLK